ncbi:MAG TPA: hypothetical protein PKE47_00785, partial [Verrucomicrobiota bacterium]|nr:hypothetical protein [Verrucomicrobiota bacterium]
AGIIIFVPAMGRPALQIPAAGGEARPLPGPLGGMQAQWPHFLPDGRRFLILTTNVAGGHEIVAASLDTPEVRPVLKVDSRVEYAGGFLFFGDGNALHARRFDEGSLTFSGERVRVADQVGLATGNLSAYSFSVSPAGALVTGGGVFLPETQLTWFDRSGARQATVGDPGRYVGFEPSPDFHQAVLERHDLRLNRIDLWLMNLESGLGTLFLASPQERRWAAGTPLWGRAGDRIYFARGAVIDQDALVEALQAWPPPAFRG